MSAEDVHACRQRLQAEVAAVQLDVAALVEELRLLRADADLRDARSEWIDAAKARLHLLREHGRHLLKHLEELVRERPGD